MTMTMPSYQHTTPTTSISVDEEKCPIPGPGTTRTLVRRCRSTCRAVGVAVLGLLLVAVAAGLVLQGGGRYEHHAESRTAVQDLMVTTSTVDYNPCLVAPPGTAFNGELGVHDACTTIFGSGAPFETCYQWGDSYCWTKSYWDEPNSGFCPCWPNVEKTTKYND